MSQIARPIRTGARVSASEPLAIDGGSPLRDRSWPAWPRVTERTEAIILDALRSGRWTVSGAFTGREPYERQFAQEFARFHDVSDCVPTCHGSSALVVALEALGVGPGCEVLVPGLTWVACASAVAQVGGVPILVDVDPDTLCMSLDAAEDAISERTAAILVVHLFCSAADLDGFGRLRDLHRVPLIEDCSQAHGAIWRGRRVGSFGDVAAFSFQQTKLLTSGEGGAVLTSEPELGDRMQQLRADGRRIAARPRVGRLDLEEIGTIQGHNYCLSEFHAALLLDGLGRLDTENEIRRQNAQLLARLLEDVGGVRPVGRPEGLEREVYYHLCLRVEPQLFGGASVDWLADALAAELGLLIEPVDRPLNQHPLYDPRRSPRTPTAQFELLDPSRFELPVAVQARRTCLTVPHHALLGDESDMRDIAAAFEKLKQRAARRTREAR